MGFTVKIAFEGQGEAGRVKNVHQLFPVANLCEVRSVETVSSNTWASQSSCRASQGVI